MRYRDGEGEVELDRIPGGRRDRSRARPLQLHVRGCHARETASRTLTGKPRKESGLDCLMCERLRIRSRAACNQLVSASCDPEWESE